MGGKGDRAEGAEGAGESRAKEACVPAALARIVHRDLKPANVLINSNGRAKIRWCEPCAIAVTVAHSAASWACMQLRLR